MKPLVLVKHSTPEIEDTVPARDWRLSEEGRVRAERLAGILRKYKPDAIVSSVEPKAHETAHILAENLGLGYRTFEDLHEHERTNIPFYSKEDFQAMVRESFERPDELVFGNETANQALTRFGAAVDVVLDSHPGQAVVIVAHGTVISLFVSQVTGCEVFPLWRELGLPSFVVLDLQSGVLLETVNIP
jgi:broad specificity phosphatase PhoE